MQRSGRGILRLILIPLLVATAVTTAFFLTVARSKPVAPAPEPKVEVVVAKTAIAAHVAVQASDLAMAQVPAALMGHGEFTRLDAVVGQLTTQPVMAGQILLAGQVVAPEKGSLAYQIPTGMRAMTLRVDEYTGVAGFPGIGDRVDVVLALPKDKESQRPALTRMLAQNLLVLASGPAQGGAKNEKGDKTSGVAGSSPLGQHLTSYTLAVAPEQATLLALGQQEGQLVLVLRPVPNPSSPNLPIVTDAQLAK